MAYAHTYNGGSKSGSVSANTSDTRTYSAYSPPAGEYVAAIKVTRSTGTGTSSISLKPYSTAANTTSLGFDNWYGYDSSGNSTSPRTMKNCFNYTEGGSPKVILKNGTTKAIAITTAVYYATFKLPTYGITCLAPLGQGTLKASSTSGYKGQKITLTVTPEDGYQWSSYTSNPNVTITNNTFSMLGSAITVSANFTKRSYTINVISEDIEKGRIVEGHGVNTWEYQSYHNIQAVPNIGYSFKQWEASNPSLINYGIMDPYSQGTQYRVGTSDNSIIARFDPDDFVVTVASDDPSHGTVSGSGTFAYKQTVSISATATSPYIFAGWTSTVPNIIANPSLENTTITVPAEDVTITANFTSEQSVVKYYDGTNFIPCTVMYYHNGNFVQCDPYYFDGTNWRLCSAT